MTHIKGDGIKGDTIPGFSQGLMKGSPTFAGNKKNWVSKLFTFIYN